MLFDQYPLKSGLPSDKRGGIHLEFVTDALFAARLPLETGAWPMTCIGAARTAAEIITRVGKRDFMVNLLHAFWSFEAGASWLGVYFLLSASGAPAVPGSAPRNTFRPSGRVRSLALPLGDPSFA